MPATIGGEGCASAPVGLMMVAMPTRSRRSVIVAALASIVVPLTACGTAASLSHSAGDGSSGGQSSARADSGIRGRVVLGPTCPVERPGRPCSRPYETTIVIRREPGGKLAAQAHSSARGRFSVALAPGTYRLVPAVEGAFARTSPQRVTVQSHRYATVVIRYDTGIR